MSNVIVNSNTYNDISEIKLAKADGSGYASYTEGQTDEGLTWTAATLNFSGEIPDDIDDPDVTNPAIGRLQSTKFGTIKLTGATKMRGGCPYSTFDNLLLPNVVSADNFTNFGAREYLDVRRSFAGVKCNGILDLRSFATGANWGSNMFQYAEINTLRLGALALISNSFVTATITNLIWDCSNTASNNITAALNASTRITNLYVPTAYVSQIADGITAGTITKVSHVYDIADWSDS